MIYSFTFILHKYVSQITIYSQYWEWHLPILILPMITSSETPDNPPGVSQFYPPSTSQTTCTVSAAGLSFHNIIRYNRDISCPSSPFFNYSQINPRWHKLMVSGWDNLLLPPYSLQDYLILSRLVS